MFVNKVSDANKLNLEDLAKTNQKNEKKTEQKSKQQVFNISNEDKYIDAINLSSSSQLSASKDTGKSSGSGTLGDAGIELTPLGRALVGDTPKVDVDLNNIRISQ